jgi:hypothetical protein
MVEVLPKVDKTLFEPLLEMLDHVRLKKHYTEEYCKRNGKKNSCSFRKNFPEHFSSIFGVVKLFGNARVYHGSHMISLASTKYPDVYEELKRIGDLIVPFEYSSVLVNNNTVCGKHFDSNNVGVSLIVSIGDYTGCNLVIEGIEYDARYQPLIFNGAEHEHWNTDDLVGNKYSIVYYHIPHNLK